MLKISIITPSYNQGQYLEETIQSVLDQPYPNLEYIIMDGGSTDNSVEIIKKYESQLAHWESKPDDGQADAINKGFKMATGDVLGWLNSDDYYTPGALREVAEYFNADDLKIVFGECALYHEKSGKVKSSIVFKRAQSHKIEYSDYIIQPSSFWTRKTWEQVGELNLKLNYTFDWDWYIRAERAGVAFHPVHQTWSVYRYHDQHKTGTGGDKRELELAGIYEHYHSALLGQKYLERRSMQKKINQLNRMNRMLSLFGLHGPFDVRKSLWRKHFSQLTWEEFLGIARM
jgi:glycosyltransferase involved in cell wall biosynthesis